MPISSFFTSGISPKIKFEKEVILEGSIAKCEGGKKIKTLDFYTWFLVCAMNIESWLNQLYIIYCL